MKLSFWALEHLRFALMFILFVGLPTFFGFPGAVVLLWLEGLSSAAIGAFRWIGLIRLFEGRKTGFNHFELNRLAITPGGVLLGIFSLFRPAQPAVQERQHSAGRLQRWPGFRLLSGL